MALSSIWYSTYQRNCRVNIGLGAIAIIVLVVVVAVL